MTNLANNKRLTYEQFRKIALSDTPDMLLKLSKDAMPDEIPRSLLKEVDYKHRPMLENLIFDISSHKLNLVMGLAKEMGQETQDAVTFAKAPVESEEFALFKQVSSELAHAYVKAKGQNKQISQAAFKQQFAHIKPALMELRHRIGANLNARTIITEARQKVGAQYLPLLEQSIEMLDFKRVTVEKSIGAFFFICISITAQHMAHNRAHIENAEREAEDLYASIRLMRDELNNLCSNYFKKKVNSAQVNQIKAEIIKTEEHIKSLDVVISEENLLLWLDVLVEASLSEESVRKSDSIIRSARLSLFFLLNKYCFLQEDGARQVAETPFLRADPKKTIQFMLSSEAFILKYFSEKRLEMSSWLGTSATSRIEDISNLEKDLLVQMKKSSKKLG